MSIPTEASTSTMWIERECAAVVVVFLFVGFQSFHSYLHCLNLAQGNKPSSAYHLFISFRVFGEVVFSVVPLSPEKSPKESFGPWLVGAFAG